MRTRPMILLAALPLLLLSGCRDATEPTAADPLEKVSHELPRRLTWSGEDDRSPAWSASGEAIYYNTPGLPPFAQTPGLLVRIPAVGGDARPALPEAQLPFGPERWFTAAVPSPGGDRVAYVELRSMSTGNLCPGSPNVSCSPAGTQSFGPHLREAVFRVRVPGSASTIEQDPSFAHRFEGVVDLEPPPELLRLVEVHLFPFHLLFNAERSYVFRPSWSPDGRRVVFSSGRALSVWEVDSDQPPVSVTDDIEAVYPAWSPDGEWIAFTRLVAGDPLYGECDYRTNFGNVACHQIRTVHPVEGRRIMLVRPDGSELVDLGEGEQPAWTPDSNRLVYRRDGRLVVASIQGGAVLPVPDSEGGIEPAVSPDGRFVAFARPGGGGDYDIWVTRLEEEAP